MRELVKKRIKTSKEKPQNKEQPKNNQPNKNNQKHQSNTVNYTSQIIVTSGTKTRDRQARNRQGRHGKATIPSTGVLEWKSHKEGKNIFRDKIEGNVHE